ncbi:hypothetical protein Q8A73_006204 [Channa argus]|nr:hypothetical protein Q8A73_006204 [Channa argus]
MHTGGPKATIQEQDLWLCPRPAGEQKLVGHQPTQENEVPQERSCDFLPTEVGGQVVIADVLRRSSVPDHLTLSPNTTSRTLLSIYFLPNTPDPNRGLWYRRYRATSSAPPVASTSEPGDAASGTKAAPIDPADWPCPLTDKFFFLQPSGVFSTPPAPLSNLPQPPHLSLI